MTCQNLSAGTKLIYGMEFLPRLLDSFSRERIPREKQKTSDTIFDWCRLFASSGAVGIVCPCRAVVHTISVG